MQATGFRPYDGDRYLRWPEIEAWLAAAAAAHPEWIDLQTVGHSRQGRPLYLVTIGAAGPERAQRPAVWLDAGTHAAEWTGIMAAVHTVSRWLVGLTSGDAALTGWFENHTAFVMPCLSPDGFDAMREGHPFVRSGLRPPTEGTVRVGLDPRDMDGDGAVRWMRWKHPAGPFVADPDVPALMRPRRLDDDPADAYFLCDEGELLEWDGHRWQSATLAFGLDLNRNFPAHWAPFSMFGMDGGAFPMSEPESRATVEAFTARSSIGAAITHHTYTGVLLTQPYRKDTPLGRGDILLMEQLGKEAVEGTGYGVSRVHPDFTYDPNQAIIGVWADAMTTTFGVPGYTLELWDPFKYTGVEVKNPIDFFMKPDAELIGKMVAAFCKDPGAYTDWTPFEHPQLGPVEIGGIDYLRTVRNPPVPKLAEECDRGFVVVDRIRRALPRVKASVHTTAMAEDLTRVELVLENEGYLGTGGLSHGEGLVGTPKVSAALELGDGVELAQGPIRQGLSHLDGWGSIRSSAGHPIYPALGGRGHRAVARWWVRGTGDVSIAWIGGRGGRGRETVKV